MRILIEPNDVLMFRESKPYTAGEAHLARSIYPLPQAIVGALRTAILTKNNFSDDAKNFVGYKNEEPNFEVLGHFLFRDEEFFHTPLDVAKAKDVEGYFLVKPMCWNDKFIFKGKSIHFESVGGFISYDNLVKYLKGELEEGKLEEIVEQGLICRETRVGIKLNYGKTAEEGFFYKAEFLRLSKGVGISVWLGENGGKVKEFLKDEKGMLRLGGENRFVRFVIQDDNPLSKLEWEWEEIKEKINEEKRFKLYVATPLLVKNNNRYTWNTEPILKKIDVKKVYPLIGKPITFSGWDYANNKPKPNRYAIPSGSVYFIEFKGEFNLSKPYLKLGELTRLGFGFCFLGVW